MTTKHLTVLATMLLGGLTPGSTAAQAQIWSSAASVCQPGSDSIGSYAFNVATFEFAGSDTGTIKTRCSVTNPLDSAHRPGRRWWWAIRIPMVPESITRWTRRYSVSKTTGTSYIIKVFDSSSFAVTTAASRSVTFTHTFDFVNYAYFVTLSVTRADANQNPAVWFVELE